MGDLFKMSVKHIATHYYNIDGVIRNVDLEAEDIANLIIHNERIKQAQINLASRYLRKMNLGEI